MKENKKINLNNIIATINELSGLDISRVTRNQQQVGCRALYYHIASTYTVQIYESITSVVNLNHCALINSRKTLNYFLNNEPYKSLYESTLEMLGLKDKPKPIMEKETKLPSYIVSHLKEYSEPQLLELYETRLKPFKKALDSRIIPKKIENIVGAKIR